MVVETNEVMRPLKYVRMSLSDFGNGGKVFEGSSASP